MVGDKHQQFSGDFNDPGALLKTCQRMKLEGIVSKRRESPYRSGPTRDWLKIKYYGLAYREPRTLGAVREAALTCSPQ